MIPASLTSPHNIRLSRAAPILVSVLVSGQYHHYLMILESAKYAIQVPSTDSAVNIGNGM